MLEDLERLITWARMTFKWSKSRSLVLKKERVDNNTRFKARGEDIPTLSEGRALGSSLMTTSRIQHN